MLNVDLEKIEGVIEPLLAQEAVELVDLRYLQEGGHWVLRFYVDKPGGITLDDCEQLSHRIGGLLDLQEEWVPQSYNLEISSPGMDRRLKRPKDFERFSGHRVKIKTKAPRDGQRQFRGFLKGFEEDRVLLENGDVQVAFELDEIEMARLDPEIKI